MEDIDEKALLRRVRSGVIQRVHEGVYLIGAGRLTWQEEVLAGVLAGGASALASVFVAVKLFGLDDLARGQIDVTVTMETTATATGVTFHRTRRALIGTEQQGIPCVVIEQALLDVAARVPSRVLHRLLTSAWRKQLTTPQRVLDHIEKFGGRGVAGTRKLREVAELYAGGGRGPGSEAEADFLHHFYAALDAAGIEHPELQIAIDVRGGREKVVPDFVWSARRKAIEMKGLEAHGDYVIQDEDVEREAAIRAAGWDLDCVTPRAMRERREKTIARLIRFLQTPNAHWPAEAAA